MVDVRCHDCIANEKHKQNLKQQKNCVICSCRQQTNQKNSKVITACSHSEQIAAKYYFSLFFLLGRQRQYQKLQNVNSCCIQLAAFTQPGGGNRNSGATFPSPSPSHFPAQSASKCLRKLCSSKDIRW